MVKDGEDLHGLQTTNSRFLSFLTYVFSINVKKSMTTIFPVPPLFIRQTFLSMMLNVRYKRLFLVWRKNIRYSFQNAQTMTWLRLKNHLIIAHDPWGVMSLHDAMRLSLVCERIWLIRHLLLFHSTESSRLFYQPSPLQRSISSRKCCEKPMPRNTAM